MLFLNRFFSIALIVSSLLIVFNAAAGFAQDNATQIALARQFSLAQDYEKSMAIYEELYAKAPFDKSLYSEYLEDILAAKAYPKAISLIERMAQIRRNDWTLLADKAYVLSMLQQKKEAQILTDSVIKMSVVDDYQLKLVADVFRKRSWNDQAILLYESARKYLQHDKLYAQELALLYNAKGDKAKALAATLDLAESGMVKVEDVKNSLLLIVGDDAKWQQQMDKELKKKLERSINNVIIELWMWHNFSNNTSDKALDEIAKLDASNQAHGYLLVQLGIMQIVAENYTLALRALDLAEKNNVDHSYAREIWTNRAMALRKKLNQSAAENIDLAHRLKNVYIKIFDLFPNYKLSNFYLDYVSLYALNFHQLDTAIHLLKDFISIPQLGKELRSRAKLDLGDYYLMQGEQWESTLLYAQVDKDHKEDALGELAKFKNAQLSYFVGDFEWAQDQLKVLKAASSDMIANDALYLSVLITENMPLDSNWTPLQQFAAADFLIYQNKSQDALRIFDELVLAYPETPLLDDILLSRAKLLMAQGKFDQASVLLQQIYDQHKDDVLADDALYKLAQIYEYEKQNTAEALKYYELLITDFPSSTYVQTARQKFNTLKTNVKR